MQQLLSNVTNFHILTLYFCVIMKHVMHGQKNMKLPWW
jgi:hypothetical protein